MNPTHMASPTVKSARSCHLMGEDRLENSLKHIMPYATVERSSEPIVTVHVYIAVHLRLLDGYCD